MKVSALLPLPVECETFRRDRCRFVPDSSGCYVLATFENDVLYIGQAANLRNRMVNHLDSAEKRRETSRGRAIFFYWLEYKEIGQLERGWMNVHCEHEGCLPEMNKVFSPVSI
jgi:hypothetical protein